MKKRFFVLAVVLALPSAALAQDKAVRVTPLKTHMTAQSCISTVAAADRTATIDVGRLGPNGEALSLAVVGIDLTWNAAATVTLTCTSSDDGGTTDYSIQDCTMGSGTCTSADLSWSKTVTASKKWQWRIDTLGFVRLECVVLCSGAGTDTVTIKSYQTTGK